jgi:hypothetical protein
MLLSSEKEVERRLLLYPAMVVAAVTISCGVQNTCGRR